MGKAELVDADFRLAIMLLQELDALRANVRTAFWWYSGDDSEWKLVLAMPDVEKHGAHYAYGLVGKALDQARIRNVFLRDISVLSPSDEIVKSISTAIRLNDSRDNKSPAHIKNGATPNAFIEDAYVFRST
jgi:hypothetical protein